MQSLPFIRSQRPAFDLAQVADLLVEHWGITGRLRDAGGDRDQNLIITDGRDQSWLLKIAQPDENPGVIDLQLAALEHLAEQAPDLPVPRVIPTQADARWIRIPGQPNQNQGYAFRLFSYLPGKPLLNQARPPALLHELGRVLGKVDQALAGLHHPHAGHVLLWDIRQAPAIRTEIGAVPSTQRRRLAERVLNRFCTAVLPRLGRLPAQVIHGDATAENILLDGQPPHVAGLIDFGDVLHAPRALELAVAMADAVWSLEDPWQAACQIASGYDETVPLTEEELSVLWDMVCARLATSAILIAARERDRPEGSGSMAPLVEPGWQQLEALDALGRQAAMAHLAEVLRMPVAGVSIPGDAGAHDDQRPALLARRNQRLMPGLALFYPDDPLHVVRGQDVWLMDAHGDHYLDCYNNVPQVGHAHPHVCRAIARQTAALNTNTRYLYDSILAYAERLLSHMPDHLNTALFVNSGSEANDLAWQIATCCTERSGAIVTANAYHGGTAAIARLSPYGQPASAVTPGVERITVAESSIAGAINRLDAQGHGVAALMIDPVLASDGILDPDPAWFQETVTRVQAAGGLCIADEVQSGFGRMGTWWGFEARGIHPDIVTLGKPIANGYPMGVVVTSRETLAQFQAHHDYFSTFGGNPVACMAAQAVLDVIERDRLLARAAEVGGYLKAQLTQLGHSRARIRAVRGQGLFLGVELVEPAQAIALALRQRGVLVGIEGPNENVLKIRPPLTFRHEHADRLVQTLDAVLASLTRAPYDAPS